MKTQIMQSLALLVLGWQAGQAVAQEPEEETAKLGAAAVAPAQPSAPVCCFDPVCCMQACGGGGLRGGYALYFLKPHWNNDPAFRTSTDTGNGITEADTDFSWSYQPASAFWFGAVNDCGFGGRIRWFFFDQSSDSAGASIPAETLPPDPVRTAAPLGLNIDFPRNDGFISLGGALDTTSNLKMNVWDFEAMQEINSGRWSVLVTGGIRYAHISQDYKAFLLGTEQDIGNNRVFDVNGTLISGHNFNGAGPTMSIAARRSLGNTNLALFAMGRGALLFGRSIQQADLLILRTRNNTTTNQDSASAAWDKFVPVAELEMGVDWTMNVGRSVVFVEVGIAAQSWFGIGNAANNEIIGNANGDTDEISDNKSTLGLFGIKLAAGVGF